MLASVPSIGRASRVEGAEAPEGDVTRGLYEQYANQIFRYCLHQLGSREEAEDAVQSTFLNAFRGIKRGVVPELESAWLFKIAHNVCLSRRRSSWRRGRIESPADFELVGAVTPAPARRADELIGLQDVLEQMPETQRRAILLREWQGLSYCEIAGELEVSQSAVETLIFRARRALATGLEQPPVAKRRAVRAFDWGNIVTALKSLLVGGSAAAKVAATVAAVSATTVVAAEPVVSYRAHHQHPAPARSVPHAKSLPHAKQEAKAAIAHVAPATVAPLVAHASRSISAAPQRHRPSRRPSKGRSQLFGPVPANDTTAPETRTIEQAVEQQPGVPAPSEHPVLPAPAVPQTGDDGKARSDDSRRPGALLKAPARRFVVSVPDPSVGDTADSPTPSERRTGRSGRKIEGPAPVSASGTAGGEQQPPETTDGKQDHEN
jgi:RNA polymerase sigma factor (sigma-70 family)